MTQIQRAALHAMLHAILACKASITPDLRHRAESLSQCLRDDAASADDGLSDILRKAGLAA